MTDYVVTVLVKQVGTSKDLDGVILARAVDGPTARHDSYKLKHDTDVGFHLDKYEQVLVANYGHDMGGKSESGRRSTWRVTC